MASNWKDRLIVERDELANKYHKLTEFICSDKWSDLPEDDQNLLTSQRDVMYDYLTILNIRVNKLK